MTLALVLLLVGAAGLWLAARQLKDFQQRDGDFSEWIVSDATPLNRRLWRARAWIQMIVLPMISVVCFVGAFEVEFAK